MRILIAEDDQVLADGLLRTLRRGGYAVDAVASGSEADAALADHAFDLLILDLGLPRLHGLEVLRKLRARGNSTPVLILTAADSVEQRVKGLDFGADDYMAKPFALAELEARVRALTRRGLGSASTVIRHGPLAFDATGRVAYMNDQMVELSSRELSLLEVLLQRAGRLVSKEQLVERLCEWGDEVSNNAIEVYIHRLRKKIEQGPVRIATVRGLGYCLEKIAGLNAVNDRLPANPDTDAAAVATQRAAAAASRKADAVAGHEPAGRAADPRGQRSLFGEILDWMLAPLLLLWPMSVALTWLVAQNIANRPYDRALGDLARVLSQQVVITEGRAAYEPPVGVDRLLRAGDADDIYFQVLGTRGEALGGDAALPAPPIEEAVTAGELRFRDDEIRDRAVRVAYLWVAPAAGARQWRPAGPAAPPALVQVAETLDKRSQLATEIIKGVILPQFVILPVAVLLVWFALARGIAPLDELQQRIRRRAADDLSPIDERDAPEEVAPLVRAINDLLGRLDRSFATQRRFLADAAHQLKTPLSGLRTQAEIAQREIDLGEAGPESLKRTLHQIARSSQRAAHTVNQLLAMARAEDRGAALRLVEVDLAALATETVQDFVPRALERRIDLGFEGPASGPAAIGDEAATRCIVAGHAVLLGELIRNLVDNALHYSPVGGTVTVRVLADPFGQVVVLQVEDSGPGIPSSERELVFQPFYRALGTGVDGSGLGLAIVAEIARRHGANLMLDDARAGPLDAQHGPGARFTLHFPVPPASD